MLKPQTYCTFQLTLIESLSTAERFVYQWAARKWPTNPTCRRVQKISTTTRCVARHCGKSGRGVLIKSMGRRTTVHKDAETKIFKLLALSHRQQMCPVSVCLSAPADKCLKRKLPHDSLLKSVSAF